MSITTELREYASSLAMKAGASTYEVKVALEEIADQIEEELANYIELPKGADGEHIRIGDYLHSDENGKDFPCRGFDLTLMQGVKWWTVECCYDAYSGTSEYVSAKSCRHVQPDSWERIIEDAGRANLLSSEWGNMQAELVERCKKLAGEE